MNVKIDINDNELVDWLTKVVSPLNFKFDIRTHVISFKNPADLLAYQLKFKPFEREDANDISVSYRIDMSQI